MTAACVSAMAITGPSHRSVIDTPGRAAPWSSCSTPPRVSPPLMCQGDPGPRPARPDARVANPVGVALDPGEQNGLTVALQSFLEEGPQHDLQAHRELERDRRLARNDPRLVQDIAGQNEKYPGALVVHPTLRCRDT